MRALFSVLARFTRLQLFPVSATSQTGLILENAGVSVEFVLNLLFAPFTKKKKKTHRPKHQCFRRYKGKKLLTFIRDKTSHC